MLCVGVLNQFCVNTTTTNTKPQIAGKLHFQKRTPNPQHPQTSPDWGRVPAGSRGHAAPARPACHSVPRTLTTCWPLTALCSHGRHVTSAGRTHTSKVKCQFSTIESRKSHRQPGPNESRSKTRRGRGVCVSTFSSKSCCRRFNHNKGASEKCGRRGRRNSGQSWDGFHTEDQESCLLASGQLQEQQQPAAEMPVTEPPLFRA